MSLYFQLRGQAKKNLVCIFSTQALQQSQCHRWLFLSHYDVVYRPAIWQRERD